MPIELQVALINAAATIFAALVAIAGAAVIVAHRRLVIDLAREVEAYHKHEGRLVEKLIHAKNDEPTEGLIQYRRGLYRKEAPEDQRPHMTAHQARKIRRRYFSPD